MAGLGGGRSKGWRGGMRRHDMRCVREGRRRRERERKRRESKTYKIKNVYTRFNITLKKDEEKVIKKAARWRKIGINKVCIGRFNAYYI